jgi:hypothetical protein
MTTITINEPCNVIAYDPQADAIYGYLQAGAELPAPIADGSHPYVAHVALEDALVADVRAWCARVAPLFFKAAKHGGFEADLDMVTLQLTLIVSLKRGSIKLEALCD